jgi:ABC-type sugar transport system permease subunit
VATDVYSTAFRFLQVGYAQAMAMILLIVILLITIVEYRLLDRRAELVSS